jgi:FAD:protein FMN transferase
MTVVTLPAAPGIRRHTFRSMGTSVTLIGPQGRASRRTSGKGSKDDRRDPFQAAAGKVEEVFARLEARFTRFKNSSELSMVNARAGEWTEVSARFATMVKLSIEAAERTGGLFDPTVLPALLAVGYDRDFDEIIAGARLALNPPRPCGRWQDVHLDGDMLWMPQGVSLDFGGIAKGWTVDLAAKKAARHLPWVIVDAGGDLRLLGDAIPPGGLDVGVEDPNDPTVEILRLRLSTGALATSSITTRSWGPNLHHLIDPRTGLPADTGVVQATVWAPTCTEAEVGSKWALLTGEPILDRLPATLALADGTVVVSMEMGAEPEGASA